MTAQPAVSGSTTANPEIQETRNLEVVGAKGFEPSTSWSRTMVIQNLSCWIDLSSLCRPSHLIALRFAIRRLSVRLATRYLRSRRLLACYLNLAEKGGFCPSALRNSHWRW